ncbi:uncharacterized protein HMPREF1541_10911 [Cyphellophora europaea CBS 101466]|uniref:Uncharacterized protein n=1 Tax=Cyphellophora europaea (strain CBS 101466) TaxID=1220924 RepID=W2S5Q7_CYPE1|nr:uncharacterized protein HMPREF1541_10911 [Cyphellophora europaea CBS 101466]ETN44046.1 hypothetical protein HMPREF1541_10911 [Cyphellophora europaea CBS 101466]
MCRHATLRAKVHLHNQQSRFSSLVKDGLVLGNATFRFPSM